MMFTALLVILYSPGATASEQITRNDLFQKLTECAALHAAIYSYVGDHGTANDVLLVHENEKKSLKFLNWSVKVGNDLGLQQNKVVGDFVERTSAMKATFRMIGSQTGTIPPKLLTPLFDCRAIELSVQEFSEP